MEDMTSLNMQLRTTKWGLDFQVLLCYSCPVKQGLKHLVFINNLLFIECSFRSSARFFLGQSPAKECASADRTNTLIKHGKKGNNNTFYRNAGAPHL
jgi:hypothetical protein